MLMSEKTFYGLRLFQSQKKWDIWKKVSITKNIFQSVIFLQDKDNCIGGWGK